MATQRGAADRYPDEAGCGRHRVLVEGGARLHHDEVGRRAGCRRGGLPHFAPGRPAGRHVASIFDGLVDPRARVRQPGPAGRRRVSTGSMSASPALGGLPGPRAAGRLRPVRRSAPIPPSGRLQPVVRPTSPLHTSRTSTCPTFPGDAEQSTPRSTSSPPPCRLVITGSRPIPSLAAVRRLLRDAVAARLLALEVGR